MVSRRKRVVAASLGSAMAALAVVASVATGTPVQAQGDAVSGDNSRPSYSELIEMYPDEYASASAHKLDDEGEDNSHAGFQALMETPAQRDAAGFILKEVDEDDPDFTPVLIKCTACKTSVFTQIYDEYGAKAAFNDLTLNDETKAIIDGQYCDCYSCHDWDPETESLTLSANCAYANEDVLTNVATYMDENFGEKEILCGQCHNAVSARSSVTDEESAASYDPYRYGHSFEGIYQMCIEEGMYSTDEETGMLLVSRNHPQIEMFQDSVHQSMGLACTDCHMPATTDEDGNAYTSHNASGSVTDNDDAMEFCLTCHSEQDGLETVDDMRGFLGQAQAAQLELQEQAEADLASLYDAVLEAVQSGDADEDVLQQAKDDYSYAYYLIKEQQQNIGDAPDGAEIAHNPQLMQSMVKQADALALEGIELLGK